MVMCARNRARVCGFAEAAACGEVALVSPVLPLAALRAYMTFPFPYAPTDTPARFRTAKPLSTSRGTRKGCFSAFAVFGVGCYGAHSCTK